MATLDQQELLRDFPDVTESDLASKFLHAYLTPEARKNISLELCTRILLTEPELHEKLKEAHKSQNSEALDNLCGNWNRFSCTFISILATKRLEISASTRGNERIASRDLFRRENNADSKRRMERTFLDATQELE
ncbi:hypothetical protein C8R41DRAFT_871837 [Lentinula lateritia]|uniref:Uncharacterized protein n=1 Tax=Lentinula lateritia TaxID=40482 RepID=A0ABQ8UY49_9AGAR|nr:hypothetical protein C8R41DRAFT_871837 [Lentinula lateritia]